MLQIISDIRDPLEEKAPLQQEVIGEMN